MSGVLGQGRPTTRWGYAPRTISPRVRTALQLYETGIAKTKKQASVMAGLHPNTLTVYTSPNNAHAQIRFAPIREKARELMLDNIKDASELIDKASFEAVKELYGMMKLAKDEEIRYKAAVDLADRGPKTSKIQKVHRTGADFSLGGDDVALLVSALRISNSRSMEGIEGDFVTVDDTPPPPPSPIPLLKTPSDQPG